MAEHVNAAPVEHADVVKDELCKESVDTQQSREVGDHRLDAEASVDCTCTSQVSPKHSTEDLKTVKPGKDVAGKGGCIGKSPDNEVFVPAPPPATNAWTKRMQASWSAKSAAESPSVDEKHGTAVLPSESKKTAPEKKHSPNRRPTHHSAKSDPHSSKSRLEGSTQTENTSASSSKHPSVDSTENPSSAKQTVEARSKTGSEASSKADVQVKSTASTEPGGCWKKPATAAAAQSLSDTSVAQGLSATKPQSSEPSAGELFASYCDLFRYTMPVNPSREWTILESRSYRCRSHWIGSK